MLGNEFAASVVPLISMAERCHNAYQCTHRKGNSLVRHPVIAMIGVIVTNVIPCGQEGGNQHDPRLVTIVNLTAVAIRRFIKMAKKISAFKNMCEEDQVIKNTFYKDLYIFIIMIISAPYSAYCFSI